MPSLPPSLSLICLLPVATDENPRAFPMVFSGRLRSGLSLFHQILRAESSLPLRSATHRGSGIPNVATSEVIRDRNSFSSYIVDFLDSHVLLFSWNKSLVLIGFWSWYYYAIFDCFFCSENFEILFAIVVCNVLYSELKFLDSPLSWCLRNFSAHANLNEANLKVKEIPLDIPYILFLFENRKYSCVSYFRWNWLLWVCIYFTRESG